jgi:hypothetical protein
LMVGISRSAVIGLNLCGFRVKSVGGRVSNEPLALNAAIIPQDTGSVVLDAGYPAYCPEALTRVCIVTNTPG